MAVVEPLRWRPQALAQACVVQPLSQAVAADDAAFCARKGTFKLAARTARRQWLLGLSGQRPLLRGSIDPAWRRALWIHDGMPQIGDAMMDLAPRSLLAAHGIAVDLFAAPHLAALFAGDPWLRRVLSDPTDLQAENYDFVIVLSHDRKSWCRKRERLPGLPWVSLHGYYGGPDFHRARFATRRLADLLSLTLDNAALASHSAQKLRLDDAATRWAADRLGALPAVALALGGVHAERTYRRWPEVAQRLIEHGVQQLLLVGSDNGRSLADELVAAVAGRIAVLDLVGRASLQQAHALFAQSRAAVCADGGLMHLALAAPVPVVALFSAAIDPQWRLPLLMRGTALAAAGAGPAAASVNTIAPQAIADAVQAGLDVPAAT